ncbi:MAG: Crp/Fnr family transcriptional regulator [Flavobacteriaceae bacterium]|nr:Crp/Fnr family transcriptional regulator [Flavobacteriaceae bacterium]
MHQIRKYLETFSPMRNSDWDYYSSKLQCVTFQKKELLLKKGQTENFLSFVEEGTLRMYFPKIENDLTFGFVFKNQFISGYDSFLTQVPCTYQIEALSKTTVWRISHADLNDIYTNTEIGNEIGRKNAERLFLIKSSRELSLLELTAKERYQNLFSERPQLIKEIPLKYIASYIGITPQALSRIRRQVS